MMPRAVESKTSLPKIYIPLLAAVAQAEVRELRNSRDQQETDISAGSEPGHGPLLRSQERLWPPPSSFPGISGLCTTVEGGSVSVLSRSDSEAAMER